MDLEDIILSEKKLVTKGQVPYDFTYMRHLARCQLDWLGDDQLVKNYFWVCVRGCF